MKSLFAVLVLSIIGLSSLMAQNTGLTLDNKNQIKQYLRETTAPDLSVVITYLEDRDTQWLVDHTHYKIGNLTANMLEYLFPPGPSFPSLVIKELFSHQQQTVQFNGYARSGATDPSAFQITPPYIANKSLNHWDILSHSADSAALLLGCSLTSTSFCTHISFSQIVINYNRQVILLGYNKTTLDVVALNYGRVLESVPLMGEYAELIGKY